MKLYIQNTIDIITNSSSELFAIKNDYIKENSFRFFDNSGFDGTNEEEKLSFDDGNALLLFLYTATKGVVNAYDFWYDKCRISKAFFDTKEECKAYLDSIVHKDYRFLYKVEIVVENRNESFWYGDDVAIGKWSVFPTPHTTVDDIFIIEGNDFNTFKPREKWKPIVDLITKLYVNDEWTIDFHCRSAAYEEFGRDYDFFGQIFNSDRDSYREEYQEWFFKQLGCKLVDGIIAPM